MSSEDGYVVFDVNRGVIQATKDLGEAKDAAGFFTRRDKEPAFGIDVSGAPGSGASRQANPPPGKALEIAGLDPVSYEEVFPYGESTPAAAERSLKEAWEVLWKYFPTQEGRGYAPYLVGDEAKAWKNTLPKILDKGILKKNAKMAKGAGSDEPASVAFGLSLIPATMASGNAKRQLVNSSNQPLLPGDDVGEKHYDWTEASRYAESFRPQEGGRLKAFNLCPSATEECRRSCLVYTGQNDAVKNYPKLMMTFALQNHPAQFARLLVAAVDRYYANAKASGDRFVRLNVYSDIAWESFFNDGKDPLKSWFFERLLLRFPEIADSTAGGVPRVYDYTKVYDRIGKVPPGYDLTFSYSGTDANKAQCMDLLAKGKARVAIVFLRGKYEWKKSLFPENYFPYGQYGPSRHGHVPRSKKHYYEFLGYPLVDGDRHDFRPYDPQGVWVALRWKSPKGFDILPHEEAAVLADPDRSIRGPVQPAEVVKKFVVKAKWVGGQWVTAVQPNKTNAVSVS